MTPPCILVVDDEPDTLQLLGRFWEHQGYRATCVASGSEALDRLQQGMTGEAEPVDLVLLDIMMPGIDGIETCRRIRSDLGLTSLPVIMLTARTEMSDRLESLDAGANDYLTKPFNLRELKARAQIWIDLRQEMRRRAEAEASLRRSHQELTTLYTAVDRSRQEWEATFAAITDGISVHDESFRVVRANQALGVILGISAEELIGQNGEEVFAEWYGEGDASPLALALKENRVQTFQADQPGGRSGCFQITIYPLSQDVRDPRPAVGRKAAGVVQVIEDVTAEKRIQAQLIQSEKMAALGKMMASLAHEINNPLQALKSGLGLLLKPFLTDEKRERYLTVVSTEVQRLLDISGRMLYFSRPSLEPQPTDVNALLDEVLALADRTLRHGDVELALQLAQDLPECNLASGQFKQVFLNIILNAAEAMPEGGQLFISTALVNSEIHVAFRDTGKGIKPDELTRIFDPFHTTKKDGTGLGLNISHRIVDQHGGRIEVTSRVGEGSIFTVCLPLARASDNAHDR